MQNAPTSRVIQDKIPIINIIAIYIEHIQNLKNFTSLS